MNFKIHFQGMDRSLALENHARDKVVKMEKFLGTNKESAAFEFHLKSHSNHAHQEATIQIKTNHYRIVTSAESKDMYLSLDEVVEKMIHLIKKENEKLRENRHEKSNSNLDIEYERFVGIDLDLDSDESFDDDLKE